MGILGEFSTSISGLYLIDGMAIGCRAA